MNRNIQQQTAVPQDQPIQKEPAHNKHISSQQKNANQASLIQEKKELLKKQFNREDMPLL